LLPPLFFFFLSRPSGRPPPCLQSPPPLPSLPVSSKTRRPSAAVHPQDHIFALFVTSATGCRIRPHRRPASFHTPSRGGFLPLQGVCVARPPTQMASMQRVAAAPMARPAAIGVCLPMRRPAARTAVVSNAAKGEGRRGRRRKLPPLFWGQFSARSAAAARGRETSAQAGSHGHEGGQPTPPRPVAPPVMIRGATTHRTPAARAPAC